MSDETIQNEGENKSAEVGAEQVKDIAERYPLTDEHIYVITELAKFGMAYLKLVMPQLENERDGSGARKRCHFEHLKSLFEVAGPETVRHFDEMCQYLYDKSKTGTAK